MSRRVRGSSRGHCPRWWFEGTLELSNPPVTSETFRHWCGTNKFTRRYCHLTSKILPSPSLLLSISAARYEMLLRDLPGAAPVPPGEPRVPGAARATAKSQHHARLPAALQGSHCPWHPAPALGLPAVCCALPLPRPLRLRPHPPSHPRIPAPAPEHRALGPRAARSPHWAPGAESSCLSGLGSEPASSGAMPDLPGPRSPPAS